MRCWGVLAGVENTLNSQNNLLLDLSRTSIPNQHDRQKTEEHLASAFLALLLSVTIDALEPLVKSYYSKKLVE
ncbi:MAG: hypothetical protein AMS22_02070 [Thiotrichales bacterium SG8_50]|nr:MAG: hypothetical protein AMS22_02070 [Thiotrichales bacterium SG8_50]